MLCVYKCFKSLVLAFFLLSPTLLFLLLYHLCFTCSYISSPPPPHPFLPTFLIPFHPFSASMSNPVQSCERGFFARPLSRGLAISTTTLSPLHPFPASESNTIILRMRLLCPLSRGLTISISNREYLPSPIKLLSICCLRVSHDKNINEVNPFEERERLFACPSPSSSFSSSSFTSSSFHSFLFRLFFQTIPVPLPHAPLPPPLDCRWRS